MVVIVIAVIVVLNIGKCSADSSFLDKIKRILGREVKDKTIKGSVAKISCFGKKYPSQSFRRLSWYHSGKRISTGEHYKVDKYGVLTIHGVSEEDSGEFICRMNTKTGIYKFKHDVTVVQFPSRSLHIYFMYAVRLCSRKSEEFATRFVESKVKGKVCAENECELSYIHSRCHFEEFANPSLKVTVPVLLPGVPNGSCNVNCLREKLEILKEKVKQQIISTVIHGTGLKIREEPQEMSISYLETKEDNICNPGFEMKGRISRSLCIPCAPGHFLEKGYCIPCHLNQYSGKYAATECLSCFGNRVTRSRGSTNEDDCNLADPDVLWILLAMVVIITPFILICCCWSVVKLVGESAVNKCIDIVCLCTTCNCRLFRRSKKSKRTPANRVKPKTLNDRKDESKPGAASVPSFVIPSVRHSSGKSFFYKPQQKVTKSAIPPPPALPTDSMLKRAAKNMAYRAAGDSGINNSEIRSTGKPGIKATRSHKATKNAEISPKDTDDVPYFRENILKNKPMYNAIMKSKI